MSVPDRGLGLPARSGRIPVPRMSNSNARVSNAAGVQRRVAAGAGAMAVLALAACGGNRSSPAPTPPLPIQYTIGGTVSGLSGTAVLQNNGGDNLSVSTSGAFTFASRVNAGAPYSITVLTQPSGQVCTVANGSGTVNSNVTDVAITCVGNTGADVTIGGTVVGLSGAGLVLQDNGGDSLPVAASGPFIFATTLTSGKTYAVTVLTQPSGQTCTVTNGTGVTGSSNVTNVAVSCSSSSAAPKYKIVEIPRLTAAGTVIVNSVNNQGVAVGTYEAYCAPDCDGNARAWMYQQSSGVMDQLTFDPSEIYTAANGISNAGVIAGAVVAPPSIAVPAPVYWTVTGGAVLLNGCDSCWAVAANDGGTIIGDYGSSGVPGSAALMWTPPGYAMSVLPGLRCDHCVRAGIAAAAINVNGVVVGQSMSSIYENGQFVSGGELAVEWQSGTVTSLGSLQDSNESAAYGINDSGDAVGGSRVGPAVGAPTHAFLYHQGTMTDLGTLSGDVSSAANAINDAGEIVGVSDGGTVERAFVYESGSMHDLNTLIDATDPLAGIVRLSEAVSVSSNGWIAANGTDSRDSGENAGSGRAFLLIPVP